MFKLQTSRRRQEDHVYGAQEERAGQEEAAGNCLEATAVAIATPFEMIVITNSIRTNCYLLLTYILEIKNKININVNKLLSLASYS